MLHDKNEINPLHPNAYLPLCLHEYAHLIQNRILSINTNDSLFLSNRLMEKNRNDHDCKLKNIGQNQHWLFDYFNITDNDIYNHRGKDALHYLLFQRSIIYYLIVLNFVCITILLPINVYGEKGMENSFFIFKFLIQFFILIGLTGYIEMTTIDNMDENSPYLLIHTTIAIMMSIVVIEFNFH